MAANGRYREIIERFRLALDLLRIPEFDAGAISSRISFGELPAVFESLR